MENINKRVGIFIDTQNLYHSARNLYKKKVNFKHLMKVAANDRLVVRALAYAITTDSREEQSFLDALTTLGITIRSKELQIFAGGNKKADWDVGIAIDAVALAHKLDVIVLISGDGDFIPAVEYLQSRGCQVEVMAFGKSCSTKLQGVADYFIDMSSSPRYLIK